MTKDSKDLTGVEISRGDIKRRVQGFSRHSNWTRAILFITSNRSRPGAKSYIQAQNYSYVALLSDRSAEVDYWKCFLEHSSLFKMGRSLGARTQTPCPKQAPKRIGLLKQRQLPWSCINLHLRPLITFSKLLLFLYSERDLSSTPSHHYRRHTIL
jgi:hypothetical protein